MSGYTIEQIWEYLLESEDGKLEIELVTVKEALQIKQNLSVYKSRAMKDSTLRELLGDIMLRYTIAPIQPEKTLVDIKNEGIGTLLTIDMVTEGKQGKKQYAGKIRGLKG